MTPPRAYDADGYRCVPGDDRGWPGLTELLAPDGRTIASRGTGDEVEAMLREAGR